MKLELLESRQLLSATGNDGDKSKNPSECVVWAVDMEKLAIHASGLGVLAKTFDTIVEIEWMARAGFGKDSQCALLGTSVGLSVFTSYVSQLPSFVKSLPIAFVSAYAGLNVGKAFVNAAGADNAKATVIIMSSLYFLMETPLQLFAEQVCSVIGDETGGGAKKSDSFVRG